MQVYSLMAMPAFVTDNLTVLLIVFGALIAVIAFFAGFVKGFSRLRWGSLIWATVSLVTVYVDKKLSSDNPVLKLSSVKNLSSNVQSFLGTLFVLLVVTLATMLVFGFLALIIRPKRKKREDGARYYIINELPDDRDYDDDDLEDYEVEEDEFVKASKKPSYLPKGNKPNPVDRILGGLVSIANTAVVLAVIASIALLIIPVTPLADGFADFYSQSVTEKAWEYISAYTLDVLFAGIILAMAYAGARSGFLWGLYDLVRAVKVIASLAVAVLFPLSKSKASAAISGYFETLLGGKLPEAAARFAPLIGKLCCGVVALIAALILFGLICVMLKCLARGARRGALRVFDGAIGTIVMLLLGVVVVVAIAAVMYLPGYFGAERFAASNFYSSDSVFAKGLFETIEEYLLPLLDKLKTSSAA